MVCDNTIDGRLLCKLLLSGFTNLSHNKDYLDDLNVFPVSDSDTGTNMKNTFEKGVAALKDETSFHNVISVFVKEMLIGARGNSGLILSQYFRGIYEYTKDKEIITIADLCGALQHAYCLAYNAVLHPADGTILTVMRNGISRALPNVNDKMSVREFFDVLVAEMFFCTQETIKQMNVLHENNVVDSGALGLYLIFDGMKRWLHDDLQPFDCEQSSLLPKKTPVFSKCVSFFRYCTEFILKMKVPKSKDHLIHLLEKRGDSIVFAIDENILKVHIHTNEPQKIIDEFSKHGNIVTKKVDDLFLTEEFEKLQQRKHNGFAILAFTNSEGNSLTLEQLGTDIAFTVPFGRSPDEDELKILIDGFLEEKIIIFPNDKDIQERFRRIKWFSDLKNLYVAPSDGLVRTFFTLSSLIFSDEFENIIKQLERLKKQRVFQASIKTSSVENRISYSSYEGKKTVTHMDLTALLNAVASEDVLQPYSTVVIFGGKHFRQEDKDRICAHFEKNSNVEYTYLDNQQEDCDFIIGAY